jgi:hypothetical protein
MNKTERKLRHIQPAQWKQMEMTERARYVQQNEAKTKTRKDSRHGTNSLDFCKSLADECAPT